MSRFCKFREGDKQLFKLQTQIRAELNILRKTYKQITSKQKELSQRKHFPNQASENNFIIQNQSRIPSNSPLKGLNNRRGRKSVSPNTIISERKNISPQKKHYAFSYKDSISLNEPREGRPSALVQKRSSFRQTPQKIRKNSIFQYSQSQISTYRPTKRIHTQHHRFDDKFWI